MHHQPNLEYYKLKRGDKTQIAFSGGRSSAFQLRYIILANPWLAEETWKGDDSCTQIVFTNTGKEMLETYDFIRDCGENWGVKIRWLEFTVENPGNLPLDDMEPEDVIKYLRGYEEQIGKPTFKEVDFKTANRTGIPLLKTILKHRMLPTKAVRFCTGDAKIATARRFLINQLGWKKWTVVMGFRADESHRLDSNRKTTEKRKDKFNVISPMVEDEVTAEDVGEFWREQPFDLDLPNENGKTYLGNCDGCLLKAQRDKVRLLQHFPERFEWWNRLEKAFTEKYGKPHFFDEKESMESLKQYVTMNPASLKQDGAFCQASGGDCFGGMEEGFELENIFEDE